MAAAGVKIAVLDAALLFEAGWDEMCEKSVFVEAPRRGAAGQGIGPRLDEEDFAAREGVQESLDRKRARADVMIDNSGSAGSGRKLKSSSFGRPSSADSHRRCSPFLNNRPMAGFRPQRTKIDPGIPSCNRTSKSRNDRSRDSGHLEQDAISPWTAQKNTPCRRIREWNLKWIRNCGN